VSLIRSRLLDRIPGVVHGFTTREGGVSQGPLASLDLAARPHESAEALAENWRRVTQALGCPGTPVLLASQVHGRAVLDGDLSEPEGGVLGEGDAVVRTTPGALVAVRVADCVPVLLASPRGVAAVHAGWRGTAAGIVQVALEHLCDRAGCVAAEVVAAVGPCISVDAYEVGEEVVAGIAGRVPPEVFVASEWERPHVDLKAANRWLLEQAGVVEVDVLPHCTWGDRRFFSHRRDGGETGRQAAVIGCC